MEERKLTKKDIENLALGASVLGTGGGGDPYIGKLMAVQALEKGKEITLIPVDSVDSDSFIISSAFMGTPVTIIEKIPGGLEAVKALETIEAYSGKNADYITPVEAGGLNSAIPMYVAGISGKPILDGDGMGRAFPELQMVTFHLYGASATPMALSDEKGNSVVLDTVDNFWAEKIARVITVRMGGWATIAIYPMNGEIYRKAVIPGTISKAIEIGETLTEAKKFGKDPFDALLDVTEGFELFEGKIVDVSRWIVSGFAKGEVRVEGMGDYKGTQMTLKFQNENLIAQIDGKLVASVPDLITVLDLETAEPITTERLRYGYRVRVIGIPCDEKWRTQGALELVGPKYFGYEVDYTPVEKLAGGDLL